MEWKWKPRVRKQLFCSRVVIVISWVTVDVGKVETPCCGEVPWRPPELLRGMRRKVHSQVPKSFTLPIVPPSSSGPGEVRTLSVVGAWFLLGRRQSGESTRVTLLARGSTKRSPLDTTLLSLPDYKERKVLWINFPLHKEPRTSPFFSFLFFWK